MELGNSWEVTSEHGAYCYLNKSILVMWGPHKNHLSTIREAYPELPLGEYVFQYPITDGNVVIYEFEFKKVTDE